MNKASFDGANLRNLSIAKGHTYSAYIASTDSSGTSTVVQMIPNSIMAVGLPGLPDNVYFCDAAESTDKVACGQPNPENGLVLVWTKPSDTGAAAVANITIIQFEVEVATDDLFLNSRRVNYTEGQWGSLYDAQAVARVLLSDLEKGLPHYARVRARTFLGTAEWPTSGFAMQIVISKPSAPTLQFVGSGGHSAPFIRVFVEPPVDFGAGNISAAVGNSEVKLLSYDLRISMADIIYPSFHALFDGSAIANQTSTQIFTVTANESIPLEYGELYYVRIRVNNAAGFSVFSSSMSCVLLKRPGLPTSIDYNAAGEATVNLSWNPPQDTGVGAGSVFELLSYQIIVQNSSSAPDSERPGARSYTAEGVARFLQIGNLSNGIRYFASVRAQNGAKAAPDEKDWGYGEWGTVTFIFASKPTNFTITLGTALQFVLEWDPPFEEAVLGQNDSTIMSYRIDIFNSSVSATPFRQLVTSETFLVVEALPRALLYCRVAAVTKAGVGIFELATATPVIPELHNASLILSSNIAGEIVTATVSFILSTSMFPNDRISIRFPDGFNLSQMKLSTNEFEAVLLASGPCGTDCLPSSEMLTIKYTATQSVQGGNRLSFTISDIINRRWAGVTAPFEIRTLSPDGTFTKDENLNVSSTRIQAGQLLNPRLQLLDARTGVKTVAIVELSLSNRNPWTANGSLLIEFPRKICLIAPLSASLESASHVEEILTVNVSDHSAIFVRTDSSEILANANVKITISYVRNDNYSGNSGGLRIVLLTESGHAIDESVGAPDVIIAPGNLSNTSVTVFDPSAYAITDIRVCFLCGPVGLPKQFSILVTFPPEHNVTNAVLSGSPQGFDGLSLCRVDSNVVNVSLLDGSGAESYSHVCFLLQNVQNYHAGTTGYYKIMTSAIADATVMEQDLLVTKTNIIPAVMQVNTIETSSKLAGADLELCLSISLGGLLNRGGIEGGRLVLAIPPGFETVGTPTVDTILVTNSDGVKLAQPGSFEVIGTNVSLFAREHVPPDVSCHSDGWLACGMGVVAELRGGVEWPRGTRMTVCFRGLRNRPFEGLSGSFIILTLDSQNRVSDINSTMQVQILPNHLPELMFVPTSFLTNTPIVLTVSFVLSSSIPPACSLHVILPDAYLIAESLAVISITLDGTLKVSHDSSGQATNVTISRSAGRSLMRNTSVSFNVSGLKSRAVSGRTGSFSMSIKTIHGFTIAQNLSASSYHLLYDTPHARSVKPSNTPGLGQQNISFTGKHFGPILSNSYLEGAQQQRSGAIASSVCQRTTWHSDSSVICSMGPGIGSGSLGATITIEQQMATLSRSFSSDGPVLFGIATLKHSFGSAVNGSSLAVNGSKFGIHDLTTKLRAGFTSSLRTAWSSDSSVKCLSASSRMNSRSLVMTAGKGAGSLTSAVTFEPNYISSTFPMNVASAHDSILTCIGGVFGVLTDTFAGKVGHSGCEETLWRSDSAVTCARVPTGGSSLSIAVTSGQTVSSCSEVLSHDVIFLPSSSARANIHFAGQPNYQVPTGFFVHSMTSGMRLRASSCQATNWASDTIVMCKKTSGGARSMRIALTVGSGAVASFTEGVSLDSIPAPVAVLSARVLELTWTQHMGDILYMKRSASVRVGSTSVERSQWVSYSSIQGRIASTASWSMRVVVTAGQGVGSTSEAASYEGWALSTAVANHAGGRRQGTFIAAGNTVPRPQSVGAQTGNTMCEATQWASHTTVLCTVSAGVQTSLGVTLTAGLRTASLSSVFSCDQSLIELSGMSQNTRGHSTVVLESDAAMLVQIGLSFKIRVGGTSCESTAWRSETSLMCKISISTRATRILAITASPPVQSVSESISIDRSALSQVFASNHPTQPINLLIFLSPASPGRGIFSSASRISVTAGESTAWLSETAVSAHKSAGTGRSVGVSLTSGFSVTSQSQAFTVDGPTLVSVRKSDEINMMHVLHIEGSQFGHVDMSGYGLLGETKCVSTVWSSDSSVTCNYVTVMNSTLLPVRLFVHDAGADITRAFSADPPYMSTFVPSNFASISTLPVTIIGKFFGAADLSFSTRLAGSHCSSTIWYSDTMIFLKLGGGKSVSADLVLTIQKSTLLTSTKGFSFDLASMQSTHSRVNIPTKGGTLLTSFGHNFGGSDATHGQRVGLTACESSKWSSDTVVMSKISSGWTQISPSALTVTSRLCTVSKSMSYDDAAFRIVSSSNFASKTTIRLAHLQGKNFGIYLISSVGRVYLSSCSNTHWVSDTSLSCKIVRGVGNLLSVSITMSGVLSSLSHGLSYDSPAAALVINHKANLAFRGGDARTILGSNIASSADHSAQIRVGLSSCAASIWNSDTSMICRSASGSGFALPVIFSVGTQLGCVSKMFSYSRPSLSSTSRPNVWASESRAMLISGHNFGSTVLSQSARVSFSAAHASDWISDSSLHVRAAPGLAGREDAPLILSVQSSFLATTTTLFTFDGPKILDMFDAINSDTKAVEVTLSGKNFGRTTYSLSAMIGTYGCSATDWIADTSLRCKLNEGYTAGDVTLAAVHDGKICRTCGKGEFLMGCSETNSGYCRSCGSCQKGFYRDCFQGPASSGSCKPCPNEGEAIGKRFFKDTDETAQTMCSLCLICGGKNQNGSQYEASRCTKERNTVCRECQTCVAGKIRTGCAGMFEGVCTMIGGGVTNILSTASGQLRIEETASGQFLTTELLRVQMIGDFSGNGLIVQTKSLIKFPERASNLSVSALVPSPKMIAAYENKALAPVSSFLHLGPSGIEFVPPAKIFFKLLPDAMQRNWSVYKWNDTDSNWARVAGTTNINGPSIEFQSKSFSSYVLLAPGRQIPLLSIEKSDSNWKDYVLIAVVVPCSTLLCIISCVCACILRRRKLHVVSSSCFGESQSSRKSTEPIKSPWLQNGDQALAHVPMTRSQLDPDPTAQHESAQSIENIRFLLETPKGNIKLESQGTAGSTHYLTPAQDFQFQSDLESPHPANFTASNFVLVTKAGQIELTARQFFQGTNHDGTAQKTLFLTPFKKNGQEIAGHEHAQPTAKILAKSPRDSGVADGLKRSPNQEAKEQYIGQSSREMARPSKTGEKHSLLLVSTPFGRVEVDGVVEPKLLGFKQAGEESGTLFNKAVVDPNVRTLAQTVRTSPDLSVPMLSPSAGTFSPPAFARRLMTSMPPFGERAWRSLTRAKIHTPKTAQRRMTELESNLEMLSSAFADTQSHLQAEGDRTKARDAALASMRNPDDDPGQLMNNTVYTMSNTVHSKDSPETSMTSPFGLVEVEDDCWQPSNAGSSKSKGSSADELLTTIQGSMIDRSPPAEPPESTLRFVVDQIFLPKSPSNSPARRSQSPVRRFPSPQPAGRTTQTVRYKLPGRSARLNTACENAGADEVVSPAFLFQAGSQNARSPRRGHDVLAQIDDNLTQIEGDTVSDYPFISDWKSPRDAPLPQASAQSHRPLPDLVGAEYRDYEEIAQPTVHTTTRKSATLGRWQASSQEAATSDLAEDQRTSQFSVRPGTRHFWDFHLNSTES